MAKSKSLKPAEEAAIDKIKAQIDIKIAASVHGLSLVNAVTLFKSVLDDSIKIAGARGKESIIRSQEPIKIFHEVVKQELIKNHINPALIHPPLGNSKGEKTLYGYFKDKAQDVCALPNNTKQVAEVLTSGLLNGQTDPIGKSLTERTLAINVRSQMSSIAKNIDTMFERIFAEPLNLHMRCPKLVMGEFYIIPTTGYDSDAVKKKKPTFLPKVTAKRGQNKTTAEVIAEYILAFQSVNNRQFAKGEDYKYERVCLLICDFTTNPIKVYNTDAQLRADNLLPAGSIATLKGLEFNTFIIDLLNIYTQRFGAGKFI
jgi:hypothetical protein